MNFTKIHEVHTEIRKDFKKRKLVPLRFLFANLYETAIEKKIFHEESRRKHSDSLRFFLEKHNKQQLLIIISVFLCASSVNLCEIALLK
jgi:hypothetical protein